MFFAGNVLCCHAGSTGAHQFLSIGSSKPMFGTFGIVKVANNAANYKNTNNSIKDNFQVSL